MPEPDSALPGEPSLPDYLREFLGQFLADPQRVNTEMTSEFLREFYLWAAEVFPVARQYAQSQVKQIDCWRSAQQEQTGD